MAKAAAKTVIQVRDLYRIYVLGEQKVRALNGVSFDVHKGEFCAIVGTSGSGKSTLLNMLAGLEKPTKGQVVIAGEHIEKMNETKLVKFRQRPRPVRGSMRKPMSTQPWGFCTSSMLRLPESTLSTASIRSPNWGKRSRCLPNVTGTINMVIHA